MSDEDPRLVELLGRWERAERDGKSVTPEDLCTDCPELLDVLRQEIAALRALKGTPGGERPTGDFATVLADTEPADSPTDDALRTVSAIGELKFHAKGGLGAVYQACDQTLNRTIAVKFIHPQLVQDEESCKLFLREAEVTGRLQHPGVVTVHGVGETAEGRPFYVMRFIDGETLDKAIARYHRARDNTWHGQDSTRSLEYRALLSHFVSVCKTIGYAHTRGILHRDIKPSNVMLGRFGQTLVVDWGLAMPVARRDQFKVSAEQTLRPRTGSDSVSSGEGAGSPPYMSPEQAAGNVPLDPPSDIYSLGATLYKLLTSYPPYQGTSAHQVKQQVIRGEFPRPRQIDRAVPPAMEAICLKAMAFNPADRYATALDLAADIEGYLADQPVAAHQESAWQKWARWFRRHRAWARTALISLIVLLIGAVGSATWIAHMAGREHRARRAAELARSEALLFAAKYAAKTLASEIDRRWRILEAEANDPDLRAALAKIEQAPDDPALREPVQTWLDRRYIEFSNLRTVGEKRWFNSWFINDRRGTQVARSPVADSVGGSFAYRDYFHGKGHDLPKDSTDPIEPIRQVNLSAVYRDTNNGLLKVAFSQPIWSGRSGSPDRHVLGIIGMSVPLGDFDILESAILVDTRADSLSGEAASGLVLHHPQLTQHAGSGALPLVRLDQGSLARLKPGGPAVNWLTDFADPLCQDEHNRWLAAYEPVIVHGRPEHVANSGWLVIVPQARL